MVDNDLTVLEQAQIAAFSIDCAYRKAVYANDLAGKVALAPKANEAYSAVSMARLSLLQEGVLATDADVTEILRIKANIDKATDTQQIVAGAINFVGFISKFAA